MSTRPFSATHIRTTRPTFLAPTTDTYTDGIDWIAVERTIRGELPADSLTDDELREAALALARRGATRKGIAAQLSVYERRVRDWQAEAGLLPASDLCSEQGCPYARAAHGLCIHHYQAGRVREQQWRRALAELEAAA